GRRQPLVVPAERHKQVEARDQEMSTPAAGVEHGEFFERLGPALERPRCRSAVILPAEVVEPNGALALWHACPARRSLNAMPGAPPRADRVVEQELHHVMLGE